MATKQVVLVEGVPNFTCRGGRFYADVGMEGIPDFAMDPNIALGCAVALRRLFDEWQQGQQPVARLRRGKG